MKHLAVIALKLKEVFGLMISMTRTDPLTLPDMSRKRLQKEMMSARSDSVASPMVHPKGKSRRL